MTRHRRPRMGPERPFAVVLVVFSAQVGAGRWFLPGRADAWEYALRGMCALIALICLWGAWDLWRMAKER